MQDAEKYGRMLTVKHGRPICPVCGDKMMLRVLPETSGENIPAYCRRCKTELKVNIDRGQCSRSPSP